MNSKSIFSIMTGAAVALSALTLDAQLAPMVEVLTSPAFEVHNRLRLEYDDNIYQEEDDTTGSFKVIEELEFLVNFDFENTFVGLRYRPTFAWWENRDEDSTDLHHSFDLNLTQRFTDRLTLGVRDTFRYAERPALEEDGVTIRERGDYIFNTIRGTLAYNVTPAGRIDTSARYDLRRYDDSDIADRNDYDKYIGGLTYRHALVPETSLSLDGRFETIEYSESRRDSSTYHAGLGAEHMFTPDFLGNANAGIQFKDYDDSSLSSDSSPYFDMGLTFLPSPATRLNAGMGYSFQDADIFPYANQERYRVYASASHDVTSRVRLNATGSYSNSEYDAADSIPVELERLEIDVDELEDGSEDYMLFSASVSYKVNRTNWLDAGWSFSTLDSDLRRDFDRNRYNVSWRTRF